MIDELWKLADVEAVSRIVLVRVCCVRIRIPKHDWKKVCNGIHGRKYGRTASSA